MKKYLKILKAIRDQGWDKESWEVDDSNQQDLFDSIQWGIDNNILNCDSAKTVLNEKGSPHAFHFWNYPFTPYGEEILKTETEDLINKIKDGFWDEIGRKLANLMWGIGGAILGGILVWLML